jgi:hypothetical protein
VPGVVIGETQRSNRAPRGGGRHRAPASSLSQIAVTKRRTKDLRIVDTRNKKPRAWRGFLFIEDKEKAGRTPAPQLSVIAW